MKKSEKELFAEALAFIEKHELKCYVINIHPVLHSKLSKAIHLQGETVNNIGLVKKLNAQFNEENNWYTYIEGDISLTLTNI